MGRYRAWARDSLGVQVGPAYRDLWRWSVEDPNGFWGSLWQFFGLPDPGSSIPLARPRDARGEVVPTGADSTTPSSCWLQGAPRRAHGDHRPKPRRGRPRT